MVKFETAERSYFWPVDTGWVFLALGTVVPSVATGGEGVTAALDMVQKNSYSLASRLVAMLVF